MNNFPKCCGRYPEYDGRFLRCPACLGWSLFIDWPALTPAEVHEKQERVLIELGLVNCYSDLRTGELCIPMGPFVLKIERHLFGSPMGDVRKVMGQVLAQAQQKQKQQQLTDERLRRIING